MCERLKNNLENFFMPVRKQQTAEQPVDPANLTAADLMREHFQITDWIEKQKKRFDEFCKPYHDRDEYIKGQLLAKLNDLGGDGRQSIKTEFGTCFKSTIITPKIVDREKYLDAVLDAYDTWGNGMLQLRAPQKESVDTFMRENNGQLPPGVETSSVTHLNLRRA